MGGVRLWKKGLLTLGIKKGEYRQINFVIRKKVQKPFRLSSTQQRRERTWPEGEGIYALDMVTAARERGEGFD